MASKSTTQRQKSSEKVVAAGRTHGGRIGESLSTRYGASAGTAALALVTVVTDDLEEKTAAMVRSDDAHEAELRDDPEVREQRDQASDALRDKLVETRDQVGAICGSAYVAKIGYDGRTPSDPVEVLRLGRTVVTNLNTVEAPPSKVPGFEMDATLWSDPLKQLVTNLEGLTAQVATEAREAEATLQEKYAAIETYDQAFSAAANLVSSLLEISGEKALAKRVRPSTRRPGQTAESAPTESQAATQ